MGRAYSSLTILFLALIFVVPPFNVAAQTTLTVAVPDHCTVIDTDGVSHEYDTGQYLGICAVDSAGEQGVISAYTLQNFSFGLFLASLNGVVPDPASQYWNIAHNGANAQVGLSDMVLAEGDTLEFQLTDFTDGSTVGELVFFSITLETEAPPSPSGSGEGGGGLTLHESFDVPRAVAFLANEQNVDGSFDSPLLSDWVALAFAAAEAGEAKDMLAQHFREHPPAFSSVLDNERHAMALLALGIDPYAAGGVDYITPIVEAFNRNQIGDFALVNDDIFAVFPLLHAGYIPEDEIIQKIAAFILSEQKDNDSWEESPDMTAAAIQALALVRELPGVEEALDRAKDYLHVTQADDASWGNSFSTSWVLQATTIFGGSPYDWTKSVYHIPRYYLATQQEWDGGVGSTESSVETRVWATAHAIPAIQGKTWDALLATYPMPETEAGTPPAATSTAATSIPAPFATITANENPVRASSPEPTSASENALASGPATTTPNAPDDGEKEKVSELVAAAGAATTDGGYDGTMLWILGLVSVFLTGISLVHFRNA